MLAIGGTTKFGFLLDQLNWSLRKEAQSCCVTALSCWFLRFSFSIQNSVCSFFFFYHLFVIGTTGNILPQRSSFFDCVLFSPSTTYILGCLNFITLYHNNKKKKRRQEEDERLHQKLTKVRCVERGAENCHLRATTQIWQKKKSLLFSLAAASSFQLRKKGETTLPFFPLL